MEIISSANNNLVKEAKKLQQKKYRDAAGKFLIEGIRLVEEGVISGFLEHCFYDETLLKTERGRTLLQQIQAITGQTKKKNCYQVSSQVLKQLAETDTPQGIVACVRQRSCQLPASGQGSETGLILIADGLQDPGNLGTLLRTAWALRASAVICLPGTVDAYNSKVIRASMGSIFHIPLITGIPWPNVLDWCRQQGYCLVAGHLSAPKECYAVSYSPKTALIIGNEGNGLTSVLPEEVDLLVKIPLANNVESLNAAVAGSILLYEIIRPNNPSPNNP